MLHQDRMCQHGTTSSRHHPSLSSLVDRARLARTALRYAPKMDAHVFRDRALRADAVPLDELRHEVAGLEEGDWIWVDAVEPSPEDLTALHDSWISTTSPWKTSSTGTSGPRSRSTRDMRSRSSGLSRSGQMGSLSPSFSSSSRTGSS